jgi:AcrR family transcriptional regulator
MSSPEGARPLRSDARRNHGQILVAARDVFVERGPAAPLEEIARRAGVGIGTLYRRFSDRRTLMAAVVVDALRRTAAAADEADRAAPDGAAALASYLHAAVDLRVAAVIPALLGEVRHLGDQEHARDRARESVERLVTRARADGSLRPDVTAADIGMLLVRLCQPLPGGLEPAAVVRLAHRHVDVVLSGLLTAGGGRPLGGPALSISELRTISSDT